MALLPDLEERPLDLGWIKPKSKKAGKGIAQVGTPAPAVGNTPPGINKEKVAGMSQADFAKLFKEQREADKELRAEARVSLVPLQHSP